MCVVAAIATAFVVPARADDTTVPKGLAADDWSSIRAAYEAHRHAVVADEATPGHYRARNPGQQWLTKFDGRGFSTSPDARTDSALDGGEWTWGLDLVSYGRGEAQRAIDGTACIQTKGTRVEYEWNHALTEWYINDQRGLEHGYTVRERPEGADGPNGSGDGMLNFTLAVRGGLVPRVSESGRDVTFATAADGGAAVNYNGLKVFDADGVHLAASFQTVTTAAGTPALRLTIDDTNARYPLTIDPTAQQAYLKAFTTTPFCFGDAGDNFGYSVAASGDTVVVGAYGEDSNATGVNGNGADNSGFESGAVYVFVRSGTTWAQQAYLKASNAGVGDQFGIFVAISGDTVVVGATSEDSNATGVNGNGADNSGADSGAAYIFVRSGTTWTQQAYLKASNPGDEDFFGGRVSISGDTVVVGATGESSNATGVNGNQADNNAVASGAAYVFVRSGSTWTQQAYLKASNTGESDLFGNSVAVSGDTVVVGAPNEDSSTTGINGNQANNSVSDAGATYVFVRPAGGTAWTQQAYLKASNTGAGDSFGTAVAVSGNTIVVGAPREDSNTTGVNGSQTNNIATDAGAAYVFVRPAVGTTWTQQAYLKASNTGAGDLFGSSVAVAGDTVVVGAPYEDSNATGVDGFQTDNSAVASGAAYVFVRPGGGTTWSQQAYVKASNTETNDRFGTAVAVSGDTVVVGAVGEDSNSVTNGNQEDNSTTSAGAAYVFVRSGTTWTQQVYLKAANPPLVNAGDSFGWTVSVSGDTVVVGAPYEDSSATGANGSADDGTTDSGAAYVFVRSGATWTHQASLKASNTGAGDLFGWSVAVSGDTAVVGAYGEASSATGVNGNQADNSAFASGAAYVFVRNAGVWTQQAYLKASNTGAGDQFGISIAISSDTVVVGASSEDSSAAGVNGNQANNSTSASGAAYVFVRTGTTWTQQAYLKASNTGADDQFGSSVAIAGDTVVVGARFEDSSATGVNGNGADNSASNAGAAYVFARSGTTWTPQAYLKASNTGAGDFFGFSVAVSGDTVVVGAYFEDSTATGVNGNGADNSASNAGAAYVFVRSGTTWTPQAYLKASNTEADDRFGYSVSVSGDTAVVGAIFEASNATGVNGNQADNSVDNAGAAYVFVRSGATWTQQAYLKASNPGVADRFGYSLAISGGAVVVAAWGEDSNATGVNGNQADDTALDSGAAYTFALGLPTPSSPLASPASVCPGNSAALSVANPGAGIVIDWFTGSCGRTLVGTGNPLNVTPGATTTYYARARRTSDGNTSDACASVDVTVTQCCPADFDNDGFLTFEDFDAFVGAFEAGSANADFNADGFLTFEDFDAFVSAFEAGC